MSRSTSVARSPGRNLLAVGGDSRGSLAALVGSLGSWVSQGADASPAN